MVPPHSNARGPHPCYYVTFPDHNQRSRSPQTFIVNTHSHFISLYEQKTCKTNTKPTNPKPLNKMEKVKLMCSYGGKVHHRPHDRKLAYVGGDTKILTVDRTINFTLLISKLNVLCEYNSEIRLKYKLPGHDLDALISVFDDDDVENMLIEYDHLRCISVTPPRLRVFIFFPVTVTTPVTAKSVNPDFLFGFDKEYSVVSPPENVGVQQIPAVFPVLENGSVTRGSYVYQTTPFVHQPPVSGYFQAGQHINHSNNDNSRVSGNREQPVVYSYMPGGNREQPVVYSYIPVMHSGGTVQDQQQQANIPMGGSPLSYDGELQFSTGMMGATCHHESTGGVATGSQQHNDA